MFKFEIDSCISLSVIENNGYTLVEDSSGSVFLFDSQNINQTYRINTKPCCEALGYTFDIVNQKCLWKDTELNLNDFKIILNPEGNHSTLFSVDENQTCCLDISFDYMFKFDCADLNALMSGTTSSSNQTQITSYKTKIEQNNQLIAEYNTLIQKHEETPYVIVCNQGGEIINTATSNNQPSSWPSAFND